MTHHYTSLHFRILGFASIPGKLLKWICNLCAILPQFSRSSDSTRQHFSGKAYAALLLYIYLFLYVKKQRLPEHKYNK